VCKRPACLHKQGIYRHKQPKCMVGMWQRAGSGKSGRIGRANANTAGCEVARNIPTGVPFRGSAPCSGASAEIVVSARTSQRNKRI
jgi:hypothetical protein